MRYNPHKTAVEKKTAAYWDTGKTQVASKKTMNLQDGYVRLFAGDSEHVKASMGESKKLGKRIFDDPKPKANDPRPKLGGQWWTDNDPSTSTTAIKSWKRYKQQQIT